MQDTMGRNAAFLLFWGILNSYFPPDCCQTDSAFTASSSPNLSMTVSKTMEPLTNAYEIISTGSAKTSRMDTSATSETPTLTPSDEDENEPITSTDANTKDDRDQTSDSNISNSWTIGTLTGTQKPESTTETSTNKEQNAFSESTMKTNAPMTTPDMSSAIFTTTSEPKHITRSTTKSYSTIQTTTQMINTFLSDTSDSSSIYQSTNELDTSFSHLQTQMSQTIAAATALVYSTPSPIMPDNAYTAEHSFTTSISAINIEQTSQSATEPTAESLTTDPPDNTIDIEMASTIKTPVESTTNAISTIDDTASATENNSEPGTDMFWSSSGNIIETEFTWTDSESILSDLNETTSESENLLTDSQETQTPMRESQSLQSTPTDTTLNKSLTISSDSTTLAETSNHVIADTCELSNPSTSTTTPTLVTGHLQTQGTVSRQAVTPDSKPLSMNTTSVFLTTQENEKTNTSLNPFSPAFPLTAISNDSKPVTTPLTYKQRGSISIQTGLNRSDSEGTTITDTLSKSISSIPAGLTNPPLSSNTSRDGNADDSANSVKSTIVFIFNIPKVPVFKTITFNHPLVNQVTIMNTVSRP